ncbi:MAG: hypothetical protein LQ348_005471, partial [Seirophora lacunosa]
FERTKTLGANILDLLDFLWSLPDEPETRATCMLTSYNKWVTRSVMYIKAPGLSVKKGARGGAKWAEISAMGPPYAQACATLQIDPWNPVLAGGRGNPLNAWQVVPKRRFAGTFFADDMGLGKTTTVLSLVIVAARRAGAD